MLSKRTAGQSREVYLFDFLGMLQEVIIRSFPQKKVATCKQTGNRWAFLRTEMAEMPGKDLRLVEKR